MATHEVTAFGPVLSRYRSAAGLTQEELAERAGLSVRAISDLERGVNKSPRAYTARQLRDALGLSGDDQLIFERAAQAANVVPRRPDSAPEGNYLGALPARQIVAREEELSRIRSLLDAVVEGTGHLVLLSGEVGVGKTRLLQEVMIEAQARGVLVVTGRCYHAEQASPYYPFREALDGLPQLAPEFIRTDCGRAWKRVQDMMDRARAETQAPVSSATSQQELFRAVNDLLQLVSRHGQLAVLLDDLQWADPGSLKLLQHLAHTTRGSPLLVAGAFRDVRLTREHLELAQMIQTLSRERLAERMTVRRLSLEETTALVAATMGQQEASEEFAAFVYRRTKGIPRLIDGLVRALGGRLELQGEIGAGAMGRVFRAFDRVTQRTVAAKLVLARSEINLDSLLRFQQEGAVLSKLHHPHIVDIYDSFAEEYASCIIMELLEGQSLGVVLREGPLPLPRAKTLALQVVQALAYAHSQEIVHRDIKPDNVMVLAGDGVKVTDFGIARILQPDTSLHTIATTGMRMGTPLYMAPEQIEGKKIDGRTDVYALGAMLYHMVTGRPPFEGSDALVVAVKHLQEAPVPPSQFDPTIPGDWDTLILKAMAKESKHRFGTAAEMAEEIGALSTLPVKERHVRRWTHPTFVATLGALAILLIGVFAVLALLRHQPSQSTAQEALSHQLDRYLSSLAVRGDFNGTAVVARRGEVIVAKGFGWANRARHLTNGPDVKYPIAGVSFSYTVVATLKLEEEGRLASTAHICNYLPSCPRDWKNVTVGQVSAGVAGLPSIDWQQFPGTTDQALRGCQRVPLITVSHRGTDYTNCDVLVLGTIFERVTGKSWQSVVRRTIFDPAGMRDSGRVTDSRQQSVLARDYNRGKLSPYISYDTYFHAYSTPADVLRYNDALFGGKILSPAQLHTLLAPRDASSDAGISSVRHAYFWNVGRIGEHKVYYTYSITGDFSAVDMRFPKDNTSIFVISNDKAVDAKPIGVNLAKLVLGRPVDSRAPSRSVPTVPPSRAITAALTVDGESGLPVFAHHIVWLPIQGTGTLLRVRAASSAIVGRTVIDQMASPPNGVPYAMTTDGAQIWLSDAITRQLERIDPVSGKVTERIPVRDALADISVSGSIMWGTSEETDDVVRVDLATRKVMHIGGGFGYPTEIVVDGNTVWVSSNHSATVRRIDGRTNRVVATIQVGTDAESIAVAYGSVWVVNGTGGSVSRIDPTTNRVTAHIALGHEEQTPYGTLCCHGIAIGEGAVWIAIHSDHAVVRIDPRTNRVTGALVIPIPTDSTKLEVWNVMIGDGSLWVSAEPHYLFRVDPRTMAAG